MVSEAQRPSFNFFRSAVVKNLTAIHVKAIPQQKMRPLGCNGYLTAVGQRPKRTTDHKGIIKGGKRLNGALVLKGHHRHTPPFFI